MSRKLPTFEQVSELLHYSPETGDLTWKTNRPRVRAGKVAGTTHPHGHRDVMVLGCLMRSHRVAWLLMTGEWPPEMVDHKDGDKCNNRWSNLRSANRSQNGLNRGKTCNNRSGFKGVHYVPEKGKWRASVCVDGISRRVGDYPTPELASVAYEAAAKAQYGAFYRTPED